MIVSLNLSCFEFLYSKKNKNILVEICEIFHGNTNSKQIIQAYDFKIFNPRLSKSGISQKRHLVATEDISIINQALAALYILAKRRTETDKFSPLIYS